MIKAFTCKENKILNKDVKTVAIGVFDGVHTGHLELFKELKNGGAVVVIKGKNKIALTPILKKCNLIKHSTFFYELSEIKELNGEEFITLLQKDFPNLEKIVVGYDFRFGKDRENEAADIAKFFKGEVKIVDEFKLHKHSVHSSLIKKNLSEGKIKEASEYLGRAYSIEGFVVKGQGVGKKNLYPTINLENKDGFFLPKNGVYASLVMIQNKIYKGATFIGNRVSFDGSFSIENYLIDEKDFDIALGEKVEVFFVEFIRENQKFDDINALKEQISQDLKKIKAVIKSFTCER